MIEITKDNEEEVLQAYKEQLLSGEVKIIYNFYLNGQFVTDCYPHKVKEVIDAYSPLGELTIESYLDVGTNDSVRREE
jgi:hypothetical protein